MQRLEEELARKRDRIESLEAQLDDADADAKKRDHEIRRLLALVDELKRDADSPSPRLTGGLACHVAVPLHCKTTFRR